MNIKADWIAVDWGMSRLRAWIYAKGSPATQVASGMGANKVRRDGFEAALIDLIGPFLSNSRETQVIACGAVGARQGWIEAPYAAVPCSPPGVENAVRAPVTDPRIDVVVLPGVCQMQPPDVMRGEGTQIAGFLARFPDFDGTICLPGTHTEWVQISAGEIISFRTFMTGEIFALLSDRSVLRHSITEGWDQAAFDRAVQDGMARPEALTSHLFRVRASNLLHKTGPDESTARISGLLIGAELCCAREYWLGTRLVVIGNDRQAGLYRAALERQGAMAETANGDDMVRAGLEAAFHTLTRG